MPHATSFSSVKRLQGKGLTPSSSETKKENITKYDAIQYMPNILATLFAFSSSMTYILSPITSSYIHMDEQIPPCQPQRKGRNNDE